MATTLPEEVWLEIVALLGYSLEAPGLIHTCTTAKSIHALSLVSRQLRRICYPFVFRRVVCHGSEGLGMLHSEIVEGSEIAAHVKVIDIKRNVWYDEMTEAQWATLRDLVDRIPCLQNIRLRSVDNLFPLLSSFDFSSPRPLITVDNADIIYDLTPPPTVVSNLEVIELELREVSRFSPPDLSKLDLVSNGLSVILLRLDNGEFSVDPLKGLHFSRLRCIDIRRSMNDDVQFEWLPNFVAGHDSLEEIRISPDLWCQSEWHRYTLFPHVARFLDAICKHEGADVEVHYMSLRPRIGHMSCTKDISSIFLPSIGRWIPDGLTLVVKSDLFTSLSVAGPSFPHLTNLVLGSKIHWDRNDIACRDAILAIASSFPNLVTLQLIDHFGSFNDRLTFGNQLRCSSKASMNYTVRERCTSKPYKPSNKVWAFDASCRAFVKELASRMPYLESVFIRDCGNDLDIKGRGLIHWQYSTYFDIRRIGGPERLSTEDSVMVDGSARFLLQEHIDVYGFPTPWREDQ